MSTTKSDNPERLYTFGVENGRPTITVNQDEDDMPFAVWRDTSRLCFRSHSRGVDNLTFVFVDDEARAKAEKVLQGGLFKRTDRIETTT